MTTRGLGTTIGAAGLAALLVAGCSGVPVKPSPFPPDQRPVAAVLDFEYKASATEYADTAAGLAESVTASLAGTGRLKLVERSRLAAALKEVALGMTGAVDPATAARAGQLVGADYIVVGAVTNVSVRDEFRSVLVAEKTDRTVDIEAEARLIEVKTGLLVASGKGTGKAEGAEKHAFGARAGVMPSATSLVQKAMMGMGEKLANDLAGNVQPLKP